MPKLPRVTGPEALRALERLGFIRVRHAWQPCHFKKAIAPRQRRKLSRELIEVGCVVPTSPTKNPSATNQPCHSPETGFFAKTRFLKTPCRQPTPSHTNNPSATNQSHGTPETGFFAKTRFLTTPCHQPTPSPTKNPSATNQPCHSPETGFFAKTRFLTTPCRQQPNN
jgi:hypothetical protein